MLWDFFRHVGGYKTILTKINCLAISVITSNVPFNSFFSVGFLFFLSFFATAQLVDVGDQNEIVGWYDFQHSTLF